MIVRQHVCQLGADHEEALCVGLGGDDLQQRDQLAGGGQPILHQAVVAELEQLFDPDARGAEDLDDRPSPKGVVLFEGQVAAPAGGLVSPTRRPRWHGAHEGRSCSGEGLAGPARARPRGGRRPPCDGGRRGHEGGQHRQELAGAGVHA